jgi:erythromycin esterase-like protein
MLIGEASHGTHEIYAARAKTTQRLFEEKGSRAVAIEADWPDAYRVNRYAHGRGDDRTAEEAFARFRALPRLDVAQHRRADVRGQAARAQRRLLRRARPDAGIRSRSTQRMRTHAV